MPTDAATPSATVRKPTPPSLVENGRIHTGFFETPFRRVNLLDASVLGGPVGRPFRWLRLKEWVGFGINHPQLFGGILIQNAKYAGSGTVYLYDREQRQLHDWLFVDPLSRLPETLWQGVSTCGRGKRALTFQHDLAGKRHHISATMPASRMLPQLQVDLTLHQDIDTVEPLVVSLPIAPDHHTYTHKAPLRLEGTIRIGTQEYVFQPDRDLGNLDEQKTFYPYRSRWWWGCFVAFSQAGSWVMVNFVNQMTPVDLPGEDVMWVDGRLMFLPQPQITPLADGTFCITDKDERLQLRFRPSGAKEEKRNYGLIAMDYAQLYGSYEGTVVDDDGTRHTITDAFGALERMNARF